MLKVSTKDVKHIIGKSKKYEKLARLLELKEGDLLLNISKHPRKKKIKSKIL